MKEIHFFLCVTLRNYFVQLSGFNSFLPQININYKQFIRIYQTLISKQMKHLRPLRTHNGMIIGIKS